MSEPVLQVAASPERTHAIAKFVTELVGGKGIDCGDGTRLLVSPPFNFSVREVSHGIRVTIAADVEIDRPGFNPWLEYLDLYRDGRIVARLNKVGFSFDKRVG